MATSKYNSQRRFSVLGDNLFIIANKLKSNPILCRLLYYSDKDPLSPNHPDVDGQSLLGKNIRLVPLILDSNMELESYVIAIMDDFRLNERNPDFKINSIRFDVVCPYSKWEVDEASLRPFLIMQEIDEMFNEGKLAGIGNLTFQGARRLVLSPQLGGYSMEYFSDEFN